MLGLFLTSYLTDTRKISQEDFLVPRQTWVETWRPGPLARRGLEGQDNLQGCAEALGQWGFPETEEASSTGRQKVRSRGMCRCRGGTGRHSSWDKGLGLPPGTWEVPERPVCLRRPTSNVQFWKDHTRWANLKNGSGKGKEKQEEQTECCFIGWKERQSLLDYRGGGG